MQGQRGESGGQQQTPESEVEASGAEHQIALLIVSTYARDGVRTDAVSIPSYLEFFSRLLGGSAQLERLVSLLAFLRASRPSAHDMRYSTMATTTTTSDASPIICGPVTLPPRYGRVAG